MNYYEFLTSHGSYSFACGDLLPSLMILNCVTMNDEKFKETDTYLLFNELFDAFCVFYPNFQWSESFKRSVNDYFSLFHFALQDFLPFGKTMSLVTKLRYTEVLSLIFTLRILPECVLHFNYLQGFFTLSNYKQYQ